MEKEKLIAQLRAQLEEANDAYREGKPIMPDREYDTLEHQLMRLDPSNDWFNKGVNDKTPETRKFKLPYSMMSLDKVKSIDEVREWFYSIVPEDKAADIAIIATPKFDGLSAYVSKNLCATRGDGCVGQMFLGQAMNILDMPSVVEEGVAIRGEVIFTSGNWKKFQTLHPEAKSPRNSAVGLINGDYDKDKRKEYGLLSIRSYEILGSDKGKLEQLVILDSMTRDHRNTTPRKIYTIDQLNEEALFKLFTEWRQQYPIDGIVLDIDNAEYRTEHNANGNPKYSIAYKHPSFSDTADVVIKSVERNVNRKGVITPVIEFDSVNIANADISRASGVNMKYVFDWKLFPGVKIRIVRSGEVIPKIVAVNGVSIPFRENYSSQKEYQKAYVAALGERFRQEEYDSLTHPQNWKQCPVCGKKLSWNGANMMCENPECPEKEISHIAKFFEIIGLEGWKEKTFRQLYNEKLIHSVYDVLTIDTAGIDIIKRLPGWSEKSAIQFVEDILDLQLKPVPVEKFFHATGWFGDLGEKTIGLILREKGEFLGNIDVNNMINMVTEITETLEEVEGVSMITAISFMEGWTKYLTEIEDQDSIVWRFAFLSDDRKSNKGPLKDKIFCMTGFRDKDMKAAIEERGGEVVDSLTKSTSVLIVKDMTSTSSKMEKARKNGTEILDIESFKNKYLN